MSTRTRRWLLPSVVLSLFVIAACSSGGIQRANLRPCCCGTTEGDILGCTDACATGGPDCGNPLCTCDHEGTKASRTKGGGK
jgi:hypothetical protein